jgi:predicted HNH restriction endonuclease
MSAFWGYPNADLLAIVVIGAASFICLVCALVFVKTYGK